MRGLRVRTTREPDKISISMLGPVSKFAQDIHLQKYSLNGTETWEGTAERTGTSVMAALGYKASSPETRRIVEHIAYRRFMPGGRYLYAAGRDLHQVNNCYEGDTKFITRRGIKTLREMAGSSTVVLTTKGRWAHASIRSFGVQPLFKVTVKRGKQVKELHATADHAWRVVGNGGQPVRTLDLAPGNVLPQVFGYGISRTPLSLAGIQHGIVFGDGCVTKDEYGFNTAHVVLCGDKDKQLLKYFEGYARHEDANGNIVVTGLPRRYKQPPSLEEDRSYLYGWLAGYFAADGCVSDRGVASLTSSVLSNLELIRNVCYIIGVGTYSIQSKIRTTNYKADEHQIFWINFIKDTLEADLFLIESHRQRFQERQKGQRRKPLQWKIVSVERTERVEEVFCAVVPETHEFALEDNILTGNCMLMSVEDSREGWGDLWRKAGMALMTGAGIGVEYSHVRHEGAIVRRTGGYASGPISLMSTVNEMGRVIMQGGSRRSAIWAGLGWDHPDIFKFITCKQWPKWLRERKAIDMKTPAAMELTNISVRLDDEFFKAYHDPKHPKHGHAHEVYTQTVRAMCKTGEPGFSVDTGRNRGEWLRNACTELTSSDTDDVCNLGSINLGKVDNIEELDDVVDAATLFLLAGTVYSHLPYDEVHAVREKNRRLGLGLMGIHEWLLKRGKQYGPDAELETWLKRYATSTKKAAAWANVHSLSRPVKTRAIAPTGTIGIIAETTTGIEPIYCTAYKRRYLRGKDWVTQYVVDPTARRLVEEGAAPESIEDATSLSYDPERRISFQAWVQRHVDHGISSTINLPHPLTRDEADTLGQVMIKYLPDLRGITVYPSGARGLDPLHPTSYTNAVKHEGFVIEEEQERCIGGVCGA